jgi:transcription-repair coupling factor (superfamily II helicase)
LKGVPVDDTVDTEISLQIPAFLPETYVSDVSQRLALYKRLADAKALDLIETIHSELIDRFGPLPMPVVNLIKVMQVKIRAQKLLIKTIEAGPSGITYAFDDRTKVRPSTLVELATVHKDVFSILPGGLLVEKVEDPKPDKLFDTLKKTLQRLT